MGFLFNPNFNFGSTPTSSAVTNINGKTGSVSLGASDVGLTNVDNVKQIPYSDLGQPSGVATLDINGKLPSSQLTASVLGAVNYQGVWNATTNSPSIPTASVGNKGFYYKVSVAGTTNINGNAIWNVGDWIISNASSWDRIATTDQVSSVAGKTGVVTLTKGDVGLGNVQNVDQTNASNLNSGTISTLRLPVMGASGINHSAGILPDPGVTAGTSKFLCEDSVWKTPAGVLYDWAGNAQVGVNELRKANGIAFNILTGDLIRNTGTARTTSATFDSVEAANWDLISKTFTGCSAYGVNIAINNNAPTLFTYNTENFDTDNYHDNVTNNQRFVVPVNGNYQVNLEVEFATNANGIRSIGLQLNVYAALWLGTIQTCQTQPTRFMCSKVFYLGVGDYIQGIVYQDSGGVLNCTSTLEIYRL